MSVFTRCVAVLLAVSTSAAAQAAIVVGDGWEGFPWVEYKGGDARFPKTGWGMLVLTDSTLAFHECFGERCPAMRGNRPGWKPTPVFSIALRSITEVQSSSRVKPADAGSRFMLGALATDKNEGLVGIVYETESSAEAPVFAMREAQSSALDAKIQFRLKRLRPDSLSSMKQPD